jgi:uncharacterized protein YhaN
MRIIRLVYRYYGPFEQQQFDLNNGAKGLHVFYGPNEAGKSTALRGLKHLLFGFPRQAVDDFVFDARHQALEAVICNERQKRLHFVRVRGRNQLRQADGKTPLDEEVLQDFLQGLTEEQFDMLFGLDHARLVQGGREIAKGEGDLGRALFTAGAGFSGLNALQHELEERRGELYKPQGRNPRINALLAEISETRDREQEAMLDIDRYRQVERSHRRARRELHRLEEQRRSLQKDISRLTGYEASLSQIRRREQVLEELARLPGRDAILDEERTINHLHQSLGAVQKALKDQVHLRRDSEAKKNLARDLFQQYFQRTDLEKAAELQPDPSLRQKILDLAQRYEACRQQEEQARQAVIRYEAELKDLEERIAQLPPVADVAALRQVYDAVVSRGPLEERLAEVETEQRKLLQKAETLRNRLAVCFSGSLEEAVQLVVPSRTTIERFEQQARNLAEEQRGVMREIEEQRQRKAQAEQAILTLETAGPVPTEEALEAARLRRQRLLRQISRALLDPDRFASLVHAAGKDPQVVRQQLPARLRRAIALCDDLADRLRREADRVAQRERNVQDQRAAQQKLDLLQRQLDDLAAQQAAVQTAWEGEWSKSGITPKSPSEMLTWLQHHEQLVNLMPDLRGVSHRASQLKEEIASCRTRLTTLLGPDGMEPSHTLKELTLVAQKRIEQAERQGKEKVRLEQQREDARRRLTEARQAADSASKKLQQWLEEWRTAVGGLGLDQSAPPGLAQQRLEQIDRILTLQREVQDLDQRIAGIDRDRDDFLGRLNAALQRLGSETARATVETMTAELDRLQARLTKARDTETKRNQLVQEQARLTKELEQSAGTHSLEEYTREVLAHADGLKARLEDLHNELDKLNKEISQLNKKVGARHKQLREWRQASDTAAQQRQQREALLAELTEDVPEYLALTTAQLILKRAIERYRQSNQSTLLDLAGEYFARLTCEAFCRLEVDEAEDFTRLLAVRRASEDRDEEFLTVEQLSDGTRDQLFLALRLAGIDQHLARHGSMPVIVDDILVNFDDERSAATLRCLARLGKKTQILLFTHHRHLVKLAKQNLQEGENLFCYNF